MYFGVVRATPTRRRDTRTLLVPTHVHVRENNLLRVEKIEHFSTTFLTHTHPANRTLPRRLSASSDDLQFKRTVSCISK